MLCNIAAGDGKSRSFCVSLKISVTEGRVWKYVTYFEKENKDHTVNNQTALYINRNFSDGGEFISRKNPERV